MPPMPPAGIAGAPLSFFGLSATMASVVKMDTAGMVRRFGYGRVNAARLRLIHPHTFWLAQQRRQLRYVGRDPPRFTH